MAYTDRFTGEGLVVTATPTGGSLITISDDYTAFSFNRGIDNVDVTAGNEYERSQLVTKEAMDWSLDVFGGDDDVWFQFIGTPTGVMNVYRHGVGNGKEYFSFNYVLDSADTSTGTDAAETLTVSGLRNGAMLVDYGTIQGGAPHLSFFVQPVNTANDVAIPVTIRVLDASNALMTGDNTTLVTMAIGTNPASGVLDGITSVRVINGVAQFGNLSITEEGTGYTLTATGSNPGYAVTSATSSTFNIT